MLADKINEITQKSVVCLTNRCNDAIKLALGDSKRKGKTKIIMFSVGQWITYDQFAEEIGLKIIKIENPNCVIDNKLLQEHLDSETVLIMHSLSAYYYPQPMIDIYELCKSKDALLINDCCGSIGFSELLIGDYLVCSFGRWKPIDVGQGGFLATDFDIETGSVKLPEQEIIEKINKLPARIEKLNDKSLAIITDLIIAGLQPLNKTETYNLVIICPFVTDEDKAKIISICEDHKVEYKECPFDIRSERQAISIEVKRLNI